MFFQGCLRVGLCLLLKLNILQKLAQKPNDKLSEETDPKRNMRPLCAAAAAAGPSERMLGQESEAAATSAARSGLVLRPSRVGASGCEKCL